MKNQDQFETILMINHKQAPFQYCKNPHSAHDMVRSFVLLPSLSGQYLLGKQDVRENSKL